MKTCTQADNKNDKITCCKHIRQTESRPVQMARAIRFRNEDEEGKKNIGKPKKSVTLPNKNIYARCESIWKREKTASKYT